MTRATRLNNLMAALSSGTLRRADDLAHDLKVTPRTIYRDMEALRAAGVSITGTRGLGYRAAHALTLPPVSLSEKELEALYLGLAAIEASEDGALSEAARTLSERLDDVLPDDQARPADLAAGARVGKASALAPYRAALRARQKISVRISGDSHVLRPLGLRHWGRLWVFTGWSETSEAFLQGAVADLTEVSPLPELFVDEPGKRLADFIA